MSRINSMVVNSSDSITDLCVLGAGAGTDKSPYSFLPKGHHRHAYTAVYDMIFSSKRYDAIDFCELGILDNKSMIMWREYFPLAALFGFDAFEDKLEAARAEHLHNTRYLYADVKSEASLIAAFNEPARMYDIMIDDSTHLFDDQIRFANVATRFLKPGGLMVIEDIFRPWQERRYAEALTDVAQYFSWSSFLITEHEHAYNDGTYEPYFNNDKLLIMTRNSKPWVMGKSQNVENLARIAQIDAALNAKA